MRSAITGYQSHNSLRHSLASGDARKGILANAIEPDIKFTRKGDGDLPS